MMKWLFREPLSSAAEGFSGVTNGQARLLRVPDAISPLRRDR